MKKYILGRYMPNDSTNEIVLQSNSMDKLLDFIFEIDKDYVYNSSDFKLYGFDADIRFNGYVYILIDRDTIHAILPNNRLSTFFKFIKRLVVTSSILS